MRMAEITHFPYLMQATAWAALSGIGLALVIPCVQAIIAELYSPYERGRAFGFLFTVSALGMLPATVQLYSSSCPFACAEPHRWM